MAKKALPKTEDVAAITLVRDEDFYPRTRVDNVNVAALQEAVRAGGILPPVIACRRTRRLADGFHRTEALLGLYGDRAQITVEWRDYADDAEFLLDSIRLNASHGKRLGSYDQGRCLQLAGRLAVSPQRVATALGVRVDVLERRAVLSGPVLRTPGFGSVLLKRPLHHLEGKAITPEQVSVNRSATGMYLSFHAGQIERAVTHDCVDRSNRREVESLERLRDVLISHL